MDIDIGANVVSALIAISLAALSYRIAHRGATYFTVAGFILVAAIGIFFLLFSQSVSRTPFSPPQNAIDSGRSNPTGAKTRLTREAIVVQEQAWDKKKAAARTVFFLSLAVFPLSALGGAWFGYKRRIAAGPYQAKKLTDIDGFVNMLAAACESAEMNATLERVLSLPDEKRKVLLKEIIETLRNRRAPAELTDAFICLQDDAIAEKAYEALYKCPRGRPIEPMRAAAT